MPRLLLLEDRKRDADELIKQNAIQKHFVNAQGALVRLDVRALSDLDQKDKLAKATVVVAETLNVALELIKRQSFSFVISDLMLFNPDAVNSIDEPDYFDKLPLEDHDGWPGRFTQIITPSGLRFIKALREETRDSSGTRQDVPIVAMTFFWRHPRFHKFYLAELKGIKPPTVAFLPKYYWDRDDTIRDKGSDALALLIAQLDKFRNVAGDMTEAFVDVVFDAVAFRLFVHQNKFDLREALNALHQSYHRSCRSVVDFSFSFNLRMMTKPAEPANTFPYVMGKLRDGSEAAISAIFDDVPSFGQHRTAEGEKRERNLASHEIKDFIKVTSQERDANVRRFAICLALALYTYPLAGHPHCLKFEDLARLVAKDEWANAGDDEDKKRKLRDKIKTDIREIRTRLQPHNLPDQVADFISPKHHLIVVVKDHGVYLNGSYKVDWKERKQ